MQVWNVLRAAGCKYRYRTQKIAKNSPSWHHRTTFSGCIFATRACSTIGKKLVKRQYLRQTFSQYGELRPTNRWDCQQILTGFASWLHYCSDVAHRRPTKLCTIFGRLLGYVHNSLCLQVMRSRILATLLHGTPAVGLIQTLQGITELSQRAPPIFGWAAITLGIGPHSSYIGWLWRNFFISAVFRHVVGKLCEMFVILTSVDVTFSIT